MKIYDKKMFFERIFTFLLAIVIVVIVAHYTNYQGYTHLSGIPAMAIVTIRSVSISLSEEKLRKYKLDLQLNSIARDELFGSKGKYVECGWCVLLALTILVLKFSIILSVILFVMSVIYIFWYSSVISDKVKKIKSEMETPDTYIPSYTE